MIEIKDLIDERDKKFAFKHLSDDILVNLLIFMVCLLFTSAFAFFMGLCIIYTKILAVKIFVSIIISFAMIFTIIIAINIIRETMFKYKLYRKYCNKLYEL